MSKSKKAVIVASIFIVVAHAEPLRYRRFHRIGL